MKAPLYEVWGDTVNGRHLVCSILIGAVVSLSAFFIAQHFLLQVVASAQMARAYAMLVGILGCLAGGVICARLFKPQRQVIEHQADPAWRSKVLLELQTEFGDLGRLADLPAPVIAELHELDLYQLFAEYEASLGQSPAESAAGIAPLERGQHA